jgi:hypothetical protein
MIGANKKQNARINKIELENINRCESRFLIFFEVINRIGSNMINNTERILSPTEKLS